MKKYCAHTKEAIINLLEYFNYFHDACIRNIKFIKERELDNEDGSLIYPVDSVNSLSKCDILIELLHNNYETNRKDQVVLIEAKGVKRFSFYQNESYDYADIYEINYEQKNKDTFSILVSEKKINALDFSIDKITFIEK